jgi:hypothetical protein
MKNLWSRNTCYGGDLRTPDVVVFASLFGAGSEKFPRFLFQGLYKV